MNKTAQFFKKSGYKGFSLIELLIVIAILGILSSVVALGFTKAQKSARDAGRRSDLAQFRSALESFANGHNGLYPAHASAVNADSLCGASDLNLGITCPVDPKNGTVPFGYKYISDGSAGVTATKYALYEYLEVSSDYFAMCSTGTTLSKASIPTIADCP
jgi:type IV pilus assembly protein PilA